MELVQDGTVLFMLDVEDHHVQVRDQVLYLCVSSHVHLKDLLDFRLDLMVEDILGPHLLLLLLCVHGSSSLWQLIQLVAFNAFDSW